MNILLSPELAEFVNRRVEPGADSDENEVVADASRRMEKQERQAWLRDAVGKGLQDIEQGNAVTVTPDLRKKMTRKPLISDNRSLSHKLLAATKLGS